MLKTAYTLLPALLGMFLLNGCDSSCCMDVPPASNNGLQAPTPVITLDGQPLQGNLTCDPTTNQTITLTAASSDPDGRVVENIWKVDGVESGSVVACPAPGESKQICLIAVDNDNLENQTCVTLTANNTQPQEQNPTPPTAEIVKGEIFDDGINLDCSDVHDTDTIHLYPDDGPYIYGSNTPKDIKEVTWNYTYKYPDGTIEDGPHTKKQTDYNAESGQPAGTCKKWFHTTDNDGNAIGTIEISITTFDDDHQTTTTEYIYNVANASLTKKH